jgi:hypothetical protein
MGCDRVIDPLECARMRLDRLNLYPEPVRLGGVRVVVAPWLFRLPWLRRFDAYATHRVILLRREGRDDDLLCHELCHVWQLQHHPIRMPLSYLLEGYRRNRYEAEARRATELTRGSLSGRGARAGERLEFGE